MTRGHRGSLLLRCRAFSSLSSCRFIPALSPRSAQKQQTGLTSPTCRTPPGQSAVTRQAHPGRSYAGPVLMSLDSVTTRPQRSPKPRTAHRLSDPHLTHPVRLFRIAHHDGLQPTQHMVVCSLPPQGGSEGPNLHLLHSTMSRSSTYIELLSRFVAHVGSQIRCHLADV
jgi:hypothetical protein